MKALAFKMLLGIGGVAGCLAATYIAATMALQRPDAWRIDAALASHLSADYSTDDYAAEGRPPLNPEVVDAARTDEQALGTGDVTPVANPPASQVEPPTAIPQVDPASPVAQRETSTPVPVPTNTPTPEPEPTDTPEPTNTPLPPSPTATPRQIECGTAVPGFPGGDNNKLPDRCKSPTPTNMPTQPPTPTFTPTPTPTPWIIGGCLPGVPGLPGLPIIGLDKCPTPTATSAPSDDGDP